MTILTFVLGWLSAKIYIPFLIEMLTNGGLLRPNFRQELIPLGLGLAILFGTMTGLGVGVALGIFPSVLGLMFMLSLVTMSFLGFIDDLIGSRADSGLKGHLIKLIKHKQLTTGGLKAVIGGVFAVFLGYMVAGNVVWGILNGMVIAFVTNSMNLLDLRPGRSLKGFFLGVAFLWLLAFQGTWGSQLLLPLVGAGLAYFPYDLKARSMMGDAGSNLLGIGLGLAMAISLDNVSKLVVLTVVLLFHIYTERYSLSEKIARTPWLKYLDDLGRG